MNANIDKLEKAIQYAIETNNCEYDSVKKTKELINSKRYICGFGVGKFFRDAYPYIKNDISIDFMVDNNYVGEAMGLEVYHPSKLENYPSEEILVIVFVGNSIDVEKQLDAIGIQYISLNDLMKNMYTGKHDSDWFADEKDKIFKAFDMLNDDLSKEIYVHCICDIIAPHLCTKRYFEYQTQEEYFNMPFWELSQNEGYLDVGAYTGDTIIEFLDIVKTCDFIYGFEPEKK